MPYMVRSATTRPDPNLTGCTEKRSRECVVSLGPSSQRMDNYSPIRTRPPGSAAMEGAHPEAPEWLQFIGAYLRNPVSVGAILPSSPALALEMIRGIDLSEASTVVELGPGTGAFTRFILDQLGPRTDFFALELDRKSVMGLMRRFPGLDVYHDSAERVGYYLAARGRKQVDCVISGLPWASFKPDLQDRIMEAVLGSLAPGGVFTTFGYVHSRIVPNAQRYTRYIRERFARVQASAVVWRNLPPAIVYRCFAAR